MDVGVQEDGKEIVSPMKFMTIRLIKSINSSPLRKKPHQYDGTNVKVPACGPVRRQKLTTIQMLINILLFNIYGA